MACLPPSRLQLPDASRSGRPLLFQLTSSPRGVASGSRRSRPSRLKATRRFYLSFVVAPGMPIWHVSQLTPRLWMSSISPRRQTGSIAAMIRSRRTIGLSNASSPPRPSHRQRRPMYADVPAQHVGDVVDDVQQYFHDAFVDTTWHGCPHHPNHPLWFSQLQQASSRSSPKPFGWRAEPEGERSANKRRPRVRCLWAGRGRDRASAAALAQCREALRLGNESLACPSTHHPSTAPVHHRHETTRQRRACRVCSRQPPR
jgi:hypothetical protein